jgi:hypothetical protein
MGNIYAQASSVTAWLGNPTAASEVVLGGLSRVDDRNAINEEFYPIAGHTTTFSVLVK